MTSRSASPQPMADPPRDDPMAERRGQAVGQGGPPQQPVTSAHGDPYIPAPGPGGAGRPRRDRVPVRTMLAGIGLVLATVVLLLLIRESERVLVWIVIAGF